MDNRFNLARMTAPYAAGRSGFIRTPEPCACELNMLESAVSTYDATRSDPRAGAC
jgi:hypothetical protein